MNFLLLLSLGTVAFLGVPFANAKPTICYQGQSYWCQNITTAADCNAVHHCIHSVWEQEVPIEKDKSSVCQTCMDMVKMARDQLRSNETEEELRQVLEGTCNVIPEKIVRKECDKMMDSLGSYIVDTLSSEMDPAVVCSVAGLCYNDKFKNVKVMVPLNCQNCQGLMQQVERNIESASSSDIRRVLTNICQKLGSFEHVCLSLLENHMNTMELLVRNNIVARPVCDLAGVCTQAFHSHSDNYPYAPRLPQDVQVFDAMPEEDLPCDLCVQLVKHLRDILITNTTEEEFKMVLVGLCKMSDFKDECDEFVVQYFDAVYHFLVYELNGKVLCAEIKICPNNTRDSITSSATGASTLQLPLERIKTTSMSQEIMEIPLQHNKKIECAFCEYSLHVLQQEITLPSNERELTIFFERACYTLPFASVRETCKTFFDSYTAQLIALLSNDMDPSMVCPSLGVCPRALTAIEPSVKPSCPLCLLAMDKALDKVQNRTEDVIVDLLDDLCMRDEFPDSLLLECVHFITGFRRPISDMIVADFNSEEACVYIDLCTPPKDVPKPQIESNNAVNHAGNVETNEISQVEEPFFCTACIIAIDEAEKHFLNNQTDEEIVEFFLTICKVLPQTEEAKCKRDVIEYRKVIINFVKRSSPRLACSFICGFLSKQITQPVSDCIACEFFTSALKDVLVSSETMGKSFNEIMDEACYRYPEGYDSCRSVMIRKYGPKVKSLIAKKVPIGPLICRHLNLCSNDRLSQELHLLGSDVGPDCFSGPEYWCSTSGNAVECDKVDYCQANVWMSEKPKRKLKGSDVI